MQAKPTVAVVMCTYNGAQHLDAQLSSIAAQDWPFVLYVFDDVSSDKTIELVQSYSKKMDLKVFQNENNLGYVANFEKAIGKALDDGYEYIAISDQDDLWHEDRVANGMQALVNTENNHGADTPCIVHSDLIMIDANDKLVHNSFFAYREYSIRQDPCVATVLGQNGVMGNTILMNSALAKMALPFPKELHVHDYWLAVLAELFGHRVLLDKPMVSYRIHENNASNSNESIKFGLSRLTDGKSWRGFIERDYRLPFKEDSRLEAINTLLSTSGRFPQISTENTQLLKTFKQYLELSGSRRSLLMAMLKGGFFKKGWRHRTRLAYSILTTKRYDV